MRILIEVMNENFATKSDLKELGLRVDSQFEKVDSRFNQLTSEMNSGFREISSKFNEQEYKLLIKLGGTIVVTITGLAALNRLFGVV